MADMIENDTDRNEVNDDEGRELSEKARKAFEDRLMGLVTLETASATRQALESRWIEDLMRYNAVLSVNDKKSLEEQQKSSAVVTIVRHKTNTGVSRLCDMLFPIDDMNWSIERTPVPDLGGGRIPDESPVATPEGGALVDQEGAPIQKKKIVSSIEDEAHRRAKAMEEEIRDQLTECNYNEECRKTIHYAGVLGTGVIKGPMTMVHPRRQWKRLQESAVFKMDIDLSEKPEAANVMPWNFYPEGNATAINRASYTLERIPTTRRDLKILARVDGYKRGPIVEVLREAPAKTAQSFMQQLQALAPDATSIGKNDYEIWEYRGPANIDELESVGINTEGRDELDLRSAVVRIVNGHIIYARENPLETDDNIYSVFVWERDETSIFGFGIPYLMRNSAASLTGIWRMMMDNGGLAAGPNIIVNEDEIEPADGDWTLRGRKIWKYTGNTGDPSRAFHSQSFDSHLDQLLPLFEAALHLADIESAQSMLAQGDQGPHISPTLGGMSILQNNMQLQTRGQVRQWDDSVTTPLIRRFFDWNMQFNDREDIKGDHSVSARGSSVLLVKELQAQNLMQVAQFLNHPIYGPMHRGLEVIKKIYQSLHIDPEDVLKPDEEAKEILKQVMEQQSDPMVQLRSRELEIRAQEVQVRKYAADRQLQTALARVAADKGKTIEQVRAQLGIAAMKEAGANRRFDFEAALRLETGEGI